MNGHLAEDVLRRLISDQNPHEKEDLLLRFDERKNNPSVRRLLNDIEGNYSLLIEALKDDRKKVGFMSASAEVKQSPFAESPSMDYMEKRREREAAVKAARGTYGWVLRGGEKLYEAQNKRYKKLDELHRKISTLR